MWFVITDTLSAASKAKAVQPRSDSRRTGTSCRSRIDPAIFVRARKGENSILGMAYPGEESVPP